MDIFEIIDKAQDVMTSIAIPIAVYLLIKIYNNTKKCQDTHIKEQIKE